MGATGGAALAVGIWYQSIGAFAALLDPWSFTGAAGTVQGQSAGLIEEDNPQLLLEYFDMDAALLGTHGLKLIQFKVSTQQAPPKFSLNEVREILLNATQAILKHKNNSTKPIDCFIVASNREIGEYFTSLQEVIKSLPIKKTDSEFLADFAKAAAPLKLLPVLKGEKSQNEVESASINGDGEGRQKDQKKAEGTMRDIARSITLRHWGKQNTTHEKCIDACLEAMAFFTFATAQPAQLVSTLHDWLQSWGILSNEYDGYVEKILGILQQQSLNGKPYDISSVMSRVFETPNPCPFTPKHIAPAVINELRGQAWPDPPTSLIEQHGIADWMSDRSDLLRGLPHSFTEDPTALFDLDEQYSINNEIPPRIFVLQGSGGVGKSSLLARLFVEIGGSIWDWNADSGRHEPRFIGYPMFFQADQNALNEIGSILARWGDRKVQLDRPIERIAIANSINNADPAVWVGLDGMDEVPNKDLTQLARALANYADGHPNARFVLASRPEQFQSMAPYLCTKGLMRHLLVEKFNLDEAWKAVLKATNGELVRHHSMDFLAVGQTKSALGISRDTEPNDFETSIRQPLFIGVIRRVYEQSGKIDKIQAAYDGDPDAMRYLAKRHVYMFCKRIQRRLNNPHIRTAQVFNALKSISINVKKTSSATRNDWVNACLDHLDEHVQWNVLYYQCGSSDLIQVLKAGAFEWCHPSIGKYLPTMTEENLGW